MKKHFYSLLAIIGLVVTSGFINSVQAQKYCYPKFAAGGCNGNDISAFSFSNVNVTPSCISASAIDTTALTGTPITVYRGKTYQINVSTDASSGTNYAVWIDYQKDGNFEDIGDYVASEINGTFTTMTQNITIPLTATPVTTRLRVEIANGSGGGVIAGATNYNTDCMSFNTSYSGGSEDYKLVITAYPKDIGIIALTPAYCPNKKEPVQVIIQNIGLSSLSSIPFTFKVGTTTVNATYTRTIASNTQDTFTIGTFDASVAGIYNLQVYANLTGDGDRTNDTINTTLHIAQPAAPTVNASTSHCGPGSVYLKAKSTTAKSSTYWFTSDTGVVIYAKNIDSLKTPFVPIGQSDTLFAESRFDTRDTITKGNFSTSHSNYGGTMCDIFAKNTVIIDSMDVDLNTSGAYGSDSVGVWMKVGTHNGFQNDRTAWTHIATVPVAPAGANNPTHVRLPRPITLTVGTLYGLYTYATSFADINSYDITYLSSNPWSNADLTITAGNSMAAGGPFNGAVTNGRDWDGRLYYHLNACPSPRVPVSVTMLQNPNGAYLSKNAPFGGKYNKGDEVHADQVCVGDTNTYMIEPPTGMAESDYGTKWVVNSIDISTIRGTVLTNATTSMPTASKSGMIQIYPSAALGDSVFVMSVDMKTPGTGCDSVIRRYVTVNSTPKADFSFTNPCGNVAVEFTDLSSVKSAIDTVKTWTWDFGDGSATNLNRKTPYPHNYPGTGSYNVSLSVVSSSGCPASVTKTLSEFPVPAAKFGTKLACNARPISFVDSSTIASPAKVVNWAWSFGDNSTGTVENPVHSYPLSGPYTVSLLVTSSDGCKDSLTKAVRVEPLVEPKTSKGAFIYVDKCLNSSIAMSTNLITDSSSKLPTFVWNYGDGSASSSQGFHTYTKNGTYDITLIVTGGNGCIDTFTKSITPFTQPVPKITFVTACMGQPVLFVDSSGSGTGTTTYNWNFGDNDSTSQDSGIVYHSYASTGTYTVALNIQNGFGCSGSETSSITIAGYPAASFTAAGVCVGNTTVFKNTSTGVSAPGGYAWYFGDSSTLSLLANPTHKYAAVGSYNVKLVAVNQSGCANADSMQVNVNALPVIAKWNIKEHNLQFKFLPADTTIGTFEWYFSPTDSSSAWRPTYTYPATADGKYQVVKLFVTDTSSNCTSERTDSVLVEKSGIEVTGTTFDGITVFPNPFEGTTNITYTLPSRSNVNVSVYDAEGKLVAKLKDGIYGAGSYTDAFDAKKYNASEGVYFLKMYINDRSYTTKIINLK